MKKTGKKRGEAQGVSALALLAGVAATARESLHELVVRSGLGVLGALLETDRAALCGPWYAHSEHQAHRAGHVRGELAMGGRRVEVRRPRARSLDGRELPLPTWE
jgi:putative transposase